MDNFVRLGTTDEKKKTQYNNIVIDIIIIVAHLMNFVMVEKKFTRNGRE